MDDFGFEARGRQAFAVRKGHIGKSERAIRRMRHLFERRAGGIHGKPGNAFFNEVRRVHF